MSFDAFGPVLGISPSTACRVAAEYDIHSCWAQIKPFILPKNKTKRLDWALNNQGECWDDFIFTDEPAFSVGQGGRQRVLRKSVQEYDQNCNLVAFHADL